MKMLSFPFRLAALFLASALWPVTAKAAETPWPEDLYNPAPAAGDLVLPMPCGGAMAFRPVVVPAKDLLDDRRIAVGGTEDAVGYKENQRADFIAGGFSDPKEKGKRTYYIGKYEVTRAQLASVGAECPAPDGDSRLPAVSVTWREVSDFADAYTVWLLANARKDLPKEAGQAGFVRLPTETEWEYAARGGAQVSEADFAAPLFPMSDALSAYAYYGGAESSNNELQWIGLLQPNPLGLHDVLGNASELTAELFRLNRLSRLHGQAGGYVVRGGDYLTSAASIRSAARDEFPPYDDRGPRRQKTVGFRVVFVPPVLPSAERVREVQAVWNKLPESGGSTLSEPVQDDPLKEIETLAGAVQDPQVRQRLKGLGAVVAANIKTRNDQRDRAARASLNLATWLAGNLRVDTRKILGLEETAALGNEVVRARIPNDIAALRGTIGYYRDTLRYLLNDYPRTVREEQARVLRQELEARQATGQAVLVEAVTQDTERYQRDGDLPADQVELQLRRELCAGEISKAFPSACRPFRR
ncbi:formylglycine-generating enzyme family protein [Skermanella mucosa]|uniref:formylglycine-generating enzyme family protein n=1 Tax=Skermanella mucosa TaxID=1789672 RepID=UPI00192C79EF|nr:SUMF1/EgtB/PvdO family nonheme iron enzyme [Skermanella mucosa]UEM20661.1 formylglycine-generating enzyme family protein [Skermanella mucosa]